MTRVSPAYVKTNNNVTILCANGTWIVGKVASKRPGSIERGATFVINTFDNQSVEIDVIDIVSITLR